jgi:hypothetical protein
MHEFVRWEEQQRNYHRYSVTVSASTNNGKYTSIIRVIGIVVTSVTVNIKVTITTNAKALGNVHIPLPLDCLLPAFFDHLCWLVYDREIKLSMRCFRAVFWTRFLMWLIVLILIHFTKYLCRLSHADHRRSHQFLLTVMMTSWTILETRENQETELQSPNWWHELSIILLGKLQGKDGLSQSVAMILSWFIIWWSGV